MWLGIYRASKSNISHVDIGSHNTSRGGISRLGSTTCYCPQLGMAAVPWTRAINRAWPECISLQQQPFSFNIFLGFTLTFMFIYCSVEIGTPLWQLVWLYCPGGKTNKLWVIYFWTSIWSWTFEPWSIPRLPGAA